MFYNRWCNSIPRAQVQGASCGSWGCFEKTGFLVNCQKYKIRQLRELKIGFCHKQFGKTTKEPCRILTPTHSFFKKGNIFHKNASFIYLLAARLLTDISGQKTKGRTWPAPALFSHFSSFHWCLF